jgi:hypothetical protein
LIKPESKDLGCREMKADSSEELFLRGGAVSRLGPEEVISACLHLQVKRTRSFDCARVNGLRQTKPFASLRSG